MCTPRQAAVSDEGVTRARAVFHRSQQWVDCASATPSGTVRHYLEETIMPNRRNQTPNWQPISQLPLIAKMIDDGLVDAVKQYETLQQASTHPHILDDYTVGRVIKLYSEQVEFLDLYAEQLARWKTLDLNATQKKEIARLTEQLEKRLRSKCCDFGFG
ncbi:hypothetical protein [Fischerella sp. PCC 9605]|uniref:hypothetical protein n=1 Tax=Fischerella sp. PCC 9605 TaxID=1173024 RepID=UPI001E2DF5C0|nr:hypothetical protein [Fischerella sp. PCC 9605]